MNRPRLHSPRLWQVALLFAVLCGWLLWSQWYAPAQVVVSGHLPDRIGLLEMRWDSGAGYNNYEWKRFTIATRPPPGQEKHEVVVRATGEQNSASMSAAVVCRRIAIDGADLKLTDLIGGGAQPSDDGGLRLAAAGAEIRFTAAASSSIEIEIDTNNDSGKVEISINDRIQLVDLYYPNIEMKSLIFQYWVVNPDGSFKVRMDMPRYPIKNLRLANGNPQRAMIIDDVRLAMADGDQPLWQGGSAKLSKKVISGISPLQQRYFHPGLVLTQILFAALLTWLATAAWRVLARWQEAGGIFSGERRLFWLLLLAALGAYGIWLLAFWPGVTSVDSLKVWRAALLPEVVLNDHPFLNVLLYRCLAGIWQNPAIVALVQVLAMALLTAAIFWSIACQGVSLKLLLPCFALTICSVAVGTYTIVLWKDIPFAMLIVLWAHLLAEFQRRRRDGRYRPNLEQGLALLLLLLALAFTRHNGLVYLVVVPLMALLISLGKVKKFILPLAALAALAGLMIFLLLNTSLLPSATGFVADRVLAYWHSLFALSPVETLARSWHGYWGILNINQTDSKWDLWHYYLSDRQAYDFLKHARWHDVYPFLPDSANSLVGLREGLLALYRQSYFAPWVYLAWNPLYVLVLLPLCLLLYRWLPASAVFSCLILAQVAVLLIFVNILNWRYYYFVYLGGLFLIPEMLLDYRRARPGKGC